ncbi:transposase [Joostella sp. CR20]|uniref:transposase n=1 Tax=Joostella sp. CR20 TaxID=2804312 RepID=UPI00313BC99B
MKHEPIAAGYYYHIFNQGNNRENIFIEDRNYTYFMMLTYKHILPIGEIHCYCLLKNHFHFIVKTKEGLESKKISQAFSNLFNAYAKAINKSYKRTGSLFRRKYARIKIESETYFKNLVLYIHTNPKHHGFCNDFITYPHSSFQSYVENKDSNLTKTYTLNIFDSLQNFIVAHKVKYDFLESNKKYFLE